MSKTVPVHTDILGKEINTGAFVACTLNTYRAMELCIVQKINPKMIKIRSLNHNRFGRYYEANKYPKEMLVVENQDDITMYIMKNVTK